MRRSTLLRATSTFLRGAWAGCTPPAALPPEPPKVGVVHPESRELTDQETFNGWLDASQTVEVRSRVRGHVQKVYFTDGEMITKGKRLLDLDPRPFQTEIDRANEKLKIYQAQLVAAQKEEERLKALMKIGGASKQQTEKAEADVKSLDAQIAASKNEVKRAELDLDYSHIKADISGRVSQAQLTEETAILADQDKRYLLIVDEKSPNDNAKNAVRRRNVTLGTLTDDGMRAIEPADKLAQRRVPRGLVGDCR